MSGFITIYTFPYPSGAYVLKSRMEAEGIVCFLKDELTIQTNWFYGPALGGVRLQVPAHQVAEAEAILKEFGLKIEIEEDATFWLTHLVQFTKKIPLLRHFSDSTRLILLFLIFIAVALLIIIFLLTTFIEG